MKTVTVIGSLLLLGSRHCACGLGVDASAGAVATGQSIFHWRRIARLLRLESGIAPYRSPSPLAMIPRRISVVPPWMVSFGAISVA